MILNAEIIKVIMQALAYGFLAGLTMFIIPWGVRRALSIFEI
jgi:hypothetical protein